MDGAPGTPGLPGESGRDGLRGLKGEKVSRARAWLSHRFQIGIIAFLSSYCVGITQRKRFLLFAFPKGDACTSCQPLGAAVADGVAMPGPKGERGEPGPAGEGKSGKNVRERKVHIYPCVKLASLYSSLKKNPISSCSCQGKPGLPGVLGPVGPKGSKVGFYLFRVSEHHSAFCRLILSCSQILICREKLEQRE